MDCVNSKQALLQTNLNTQDENSALTAAALSGCDDCARLLLEAGAGTEIATWTVRGSWHSFRDSFSVCAPLRCDNRCARTILANHIIVCF